MPGSKVEKASIRTSKRKHTETTGENNVNDASTSSGKRILRSRETLKEKSLDDNVIISRRTTLRSRETLKEKNLNEGTSSKETRKRKGREAVKEQSQQTLNEDTSSKETRKRKGREAVKEQTLNGKWEWRSSFNAVGDLVLKVKKSKLKFSEEALGMLDRAPYGKLFRLFWDADEKKFRIQCRKKGISKILDCHDPNTVNGFRFGKTLIRTIPEQMAVVLGMQRVGNEKGKKILGQEVNPQINKFCIKYFSGKIKGTFAMKNDIVTEIENLMRSQKDDELEDLVCLIGLYLCCVLFFPVVKGDQVHLKYLGLVESIEVMNKVSWPDIIHDHLITELNQPHSQHHVYHVKGCIPYLLIWFIEHIKINVIKKKNDVRPRMEKWLVKDISYWLETTKELGHDLLSEGFVESYDELEHQLCIPVPRRTKAQIEEELRNSNLQCTQLENRCADAEAKILAVRVLAEKGLSADFKKTQDFSIQSLCLQIIKETSGEPSCDTAQSDQPIPGEHLDVMVRSDVEAETEVPNLNGKKSSPGDEDMSSKTSDRAGLTEPFEHPDVMVRINVEAETEVSDLNVEKSLPGDEDISLKTSDQAGLREPFEHRDVMVLSDVKAETEVSDLNVKKTSPGDEDISSKTSDQAGLKVASGSKIFLLENIVPNDLMHDNNIAPCEKAITTSGATETETGPYDHPEMVVKATSRSQSLVTKLNMTEKKSAFDVRLDAGAKRLMPPRLDDWYKRILEIDYFSTVLPLLGNQEEGETSAELMKVPKCFRSTEEYVCIFRPLVLAELKAQLRSSYKMSSSSEMSSDFVSVISIERTDDFSFIQLKFDAIHAVNKYSSKHLVLLTREPLGNSSAAVHVIGKVESLDRRNSIIDIRLYLQNGSARFKKAEELLVDSSKWYLTPIMSLASQLREFQVLSSLNYIPFIPVILKPTVHSNKSRKIELGKLSEPLRQLLELSFNDNQLQAISDSIGSDFELSLIQGPPGTGKTRTILAIVSALLALSPPRRRVLICAQSNAAVDELGSRIFKQGLYGSDGEMYKPDDYMVRVGNPSTVTQCSQHVSIDALVDQEMHARKMFGFSHKNREVRDGIRKAILKKATIVVSTLNSCGGDLYDACSESTSNSEDTLFDAVVIDEAAQAVEPATLIPLQLLKSNGAKCIMVGDPKQLPATVLSQVAIKHHYECSMFERLQEAGHPVTMLTRQYRMHPEICQFPSLQFYDNMLLNGEQMASKSAAPFHEDGFFRPYMFFDVVEGESLQTCGSESFSNKIEAEAAVEVLRLFKTRYPEEFVGGRIGVISPYKSQVSLLQNKFEIAFKRDVTDDMDFMSIDGYQGREVDILILSTVRASDRSSAAPGINTSGIGFVADVRRINVALTRAKLALWIFGNAATLQNDPTWGSLVNNARERSRIVSLKKPYYYIYIKNPETSECEKFDQDEDCEEAR